MEDIQKIVDRVLADKEGKEREQIIEALIEHCASEVGDALAVGLVKHIIILADSALQKELSEWGKRRISILTYQAKEATRMLLRHELLGK